MSKGVKRLSYIVGFVFVFVLVFSVYLGLSKSITGNVVISYNVPTELSLLTNKATISNGQDLTIQFAKIINLTKIKINWASFNSVGGLSVCNANVSVKNSSNAWVVVMNNTYISQNNFATTEILTNKIASAILVQASNCASPIWRIEINSINISGFAENFSNDKSLAVPTIRSYPALGCVYGSSCSNFAVGIDSTTGILTPYKYEIYWKYVYSDNSYRSYCYYNSSGDSCIEEESLASSVNKVYSFSKIISETNPEKTIKEVRFRVALWNGSSRTNWSEFSGAIPISYGNCVQECSVVNSTNCSSPTSIKICGNYDSDSCLEWGTSRECNIGDYCSGYSANGSSCVSGETVTCNEANYSCKEKGDKYSILRNDLHCAAPTESCYFCNSSAGFVFDSVSERCSKRNCVANCTTNNGICVDVVKKNSGILGATENTSLECCDGDYCLACGSGYHVFNGSCVQNSCNGTKPYGNNISLGVNVSLTGALASWSYSPNSASLAPCQWKCNSAFRINSSNNLSCVEGLMSCSEIGGVCLNVSLTNAINVNSPTLVANCSDSSFANATCYVCNSGYSWNGSSCILGGAVLSDCVSRNKCTSENDCVPKKQRLTTEAGRVYCDNESLTLKLQKAEGESCSYKQECLSNYCRNGKCFDVVRDVADSAGVFNRVLCWLKSIFRTENYDSCMAAAAS